jgi:hypothetical protein
MQSIAAHRIAATMAAGIAMAGDFVFMGALRSQITKA